MLIIDVVARLRFLALALGCAVLMTAGCGGSSAATTADGGAIDVTGTWTGMATDSKGGAHPMTMVVTQTGTDVAGMGTFDTKTTTITGKVSASQWTGSLADGANKLASYTLTVAGDTVDGSGTAAADGSSATLHLTR